MKKVIALLAIASICTQLCACQANPSTSVVISKNDGSFDANLSKSSTVEPNTSENIQYFDKFFSTDGSIEFTVNIDQSLNTSTMPVVEVVPHKLLPEDVEKIANVLFEGATFYEREPSKNPCYSKRQIQNAIARWSKYTNYTAMAELIMDRSDKLVANYIDSLKSTIAQYTEKIDTASIENPHILCDWIFKKESHYNDLEAEILGGSASDELDVIYSTVEASDVEYIFTASTHDAADYKLNTIDVTLSSGVGPAEMDLMIYRAMLCRTSKPTDEQVLSISKKAQNMLDLMELGDWVVTDTYVETSDFEDIAEHVVVVEAVPAFSGVAAIYGQKTPGATDAYSAYYPVSRAVFGFSPKGTLVYFRMQSPVDVKEVRNTNAATLSLDKLFETAKSDLILRDAHAGYGVPADMIYMYEEVLNEKLICKIEISTLNYGLARIDVANSDCTYYYIPAFVFNGNADYYGKDTGNLCISSSDYRASGLNLIWINAIDGSIILQ